MISEEEIIKRLGAVLSSGTYKDKLAKASAKAIPIDELISLFERELRDCLPDQIQNGVDISSIYETTTEGGYHVTTEFGNVWRPSLRPDMYEDGAENIVLLFNNGYFALNYIVGVWHGDDQVVSRKEREGLHFLQDFVADFNNRYGDKYGLRVTLSPYYQEYMMR